MIPQGFHSPSTSFQTIRNPSHSTRIPSWPPSLLIHGCWSCPACRSVSKGSSKAQMTKNDTFLRRNLWTKKKAAQAHPSKVLKKSHASWTFPPQLRGNLWWMATTPIFDLREGWSPLRTILGGEIILSWTWCDYLWPNDGMCLFLHPQIWWVLHTFPPFLSDITVSARCNGDALQDHIPQLAPDFRVCTLHSNAIPEGLYHKSIHSCGNSLNFEYDTQ